MKKWFFLFAMSVACCCSARIQLIEFKNESEISFNPTFCNGVPIDRAFLDQPESCLSAGDGRFAIIFEDAGDSGFYRPQSKLHVWLEKEGGFPFLREERFLYAVIFYDGEGEIGVQLDKEEKLHLRGGKGVKDILYPWAKGTIGRGNPYHEIQGVESDEKGIKYFDYSGFVGSN